MPKRTFLRRNLNFYVQKVVTGPFQENSYIIWDSSNRQAILIDPGDDCELINDQIKLNNLTPIAIINDDKK
jgi:glyoxylase-like metal-dependent hydrolase (beta-lactamase superfamily II)